MDDISLEAIKQKDSIINNMKTVILSTNNKNGDPNASYAPCVTDEKGFYYIYISRLSKHAINLLENSKLSVMIIEDESNSENIFARKRFTMTCNAVEIKRDTDKWVDKINLMEDKFGEAISYLKKLTDFHLFKIEPENGLLVYGFARAFHFYGQKLDQIKFLNDKGHTEEKKK